MSIEECQTTHWRDLGYHQGKTGVNPNIIYDYAKDCSEGGVKVDKVGWSEGFEQGLILYCSPRNGYQVGRNGQHYYGVCDNDQFNENYELGRQAYLKETRLKDIETELLDIERKLLDKNGLDPDERKRLDAERKSLVSERASLLETTRSYQFHITF
ncbi:DNA repair ATPase [Vibrio penaeicida]|uniref:DNA repair ATPase n=2 Tax=Vibrio penaeicida TaxID=104609 RepID=A0AAV5NXD3_9VIBR|nr:DNA repair ATPase [Vibrio penaeicida]